MCLLLHSPAKKVHLEEEKSGAFHCAHHRPGLGGSAEIRRILSFFLSSGSPQALKSWKWCDEDTYQNHLHLVQRVGWAGAGAGVGMKSQQTTLNANDPPVLAEYFSGQQ